MTAIFRISARGSVTSPALGFCVSVRFASMRVKQAPQVRRFLSLKIGCDGSFPAFVGRELPLSVYAGGGIVACCTGQKRADLHKIKNKSQFPLALFILMRYTYIR